MAQGEDGHAGLSAVGSPRPPRILVSGLRSTGKSSLVVALWGDSELLPTAVRDGTQTKTPAEPW